MMLVYTSRRREETRTFTGVTSARTTVPSRRPAASAALDHELDGGPRGTAKGVCDGGESTGVCGARAVDGEDFIVEPNAAIPRGPRFFRVPYPESLDDGGVSVGRDEYLEADAGVRLERARTGGQRGDCRSEEKRRGEDRRPDVSWTCSETRVAVMVRGVKTRDLTTLTARDGRGRRAARRRGVARGRVDAGDDAEAIARDTSRRVARNGRARRLCARTAGTFPRHLASCRERDTTIIRPSVSSTREASVVASARSRVDSSSPRRRRARARVARADPPRDLHVLLDVRRCRRHRRRASRLLRDHARHDRRRASRIFVQADARAQPREPSRRVRPLPPTHARTSSASAASAAVPAATTRRSSRPRYRPKTPALPQDAPSR